ncbi:sulfatase [Pelagicoccus mobilis]|uniref:Sulfatase n=1 Tax=Pelagicoccus mobilis TaxID=415221 RepID=A0A934VNE5_9BACT|nr:sulfatase [Pelagicoccus mobilis]MBK1879861.1 sulfatase [Pelagicoccus mobilis]
MKTRTVIENLKKSLIATVLCVATQAMAAEKPLNVLLIVIDDLRPELASYKAEGLITPNIDRFAEMGIQFESAYCQYPVCNPSRSSFVTGLRPEELGILDNSISLRQKYPDMVTLPQAFRNNGYYTAGIGKLFHVGLDDHGKKNFFQDNESFDYFFSARGKTPKIADKGEGRRLGDGTVGWARWLAAEGGDDVQMDGMNAIQAVRQLEKNHDKPFFISVGFHKPHDPFIAPKEYFDLYPYDEVEVPHDPKDRTALNEYSLPGNYNFPTFDEDDRKQFKRAYMACTSFTDAQIGKVFAAMDRLELWDNTIVVLMGDHGYHLGEHGWWNKVTLFDIGARVPLIIRIPGEDGKSRVTDSVVELIDLYPTLIDYAGLDAPHEMSGKSLRPVLTDPSFDWGEPAFTVVNRPKVKHGYTVRQGDWRLVQWGADAQGGFELHNVVKDREGFYNLADNPEYAVIKKRLHALLKENYDDLN